MPDQPVPEQAAEPTSATCEHYWAYICGRGLSVKQCQFCQVIDWDAQEIRKAERSRLAEHFRSVSPWAFLTSHGLELGAGCGVILGAVAEEITKGDGDAGAPGSARSRWGHLLGQPVRVALADDEHRTGELMWFTDDGSFCLREEDGTKLYGWPALNISPAVAVPELNEETT